MRVIVDIGPDGSMKVDVQGAKGKACEKATASLMQGGDVEGLEHKAEYYVKEETDQTLKQW